MLDLFGVRRRAIVAVREVIDRRTVGGRMSVTSGQLAAEILEVAKTCRLEGNVLVGAFKDGSPVRLMHVDHGDLLPIFDVGSAGAGRREGYTSWFGVLPIVRGHIESYSQVAKADADASGDVEGFRNSRDMACLEELKIDASSLRLVEDA